MSNNIKQIKNAMSIINIVVFDKNRNSDAALPRISSDIFDFGKTAALNPAAKILKFCVAVNTAANGKIINIIAGMSITSNILPLSVNTEAQTLNKNIPKPNK